MIRFSVVFSIIHLGLAGMAPAAALKVAALHPLLADLARQVGRERVQVFDLVGEGGNLHRFEPRPGDLKVMQDSALVLAGGKNLEPYLGRVRESLHGVTVEEVGRTIPSLVVGEDAVYGACPDHGGAGIDPHWWHGIDNTRRAARVVAMALAAKDPAGKEAYLANASAYGKRLGELKDWAARELAKVPPQQRSLVTAHNAFAYFAREFGFKVVAVAGLTNEQNTTPRELAETIRTVKDSGIRAIFPENNAPRKVLESIAAETGVRIAPPLIADGLASGPDAGFEGMIRHNVRGIANALGTP